MSEEQRSRMQLHEVLSYLNQRGWLPFWSWRNTACWVPITSPADVSYLADNVLLLRYFEAAGEVRQACR